MTRAQGDAKNDASTSKKQEKSHKSKRQRSKTPPPAPPSAVAQALETTAAFAISFANDARTNPSVPLAFALGVLCTLILCKLAKKQRSRDATSVIGDLRKRVSMAVVGEGDSSVQNESKSGANLAEDPNQLRLACLTWNVGAAEMSFETATKLLLSAELPSSSRLQPQLQQSPADVFCVGLQEAVPLNAKNALGVSRLATQRAQRALAMLQAALNALYREDYVAADEPVVLVGLCLIVLVRPSWYPKKVVHDTAAVGFGGLGNKGAVALRMQLRSATLCLITVHLPAGSSSEATTAREMALAECMMNLGIKLQKAGAMAPLAHDLCVVLGDYNSRVGVPRDVAEKAILAGQGLSTLLATDELTKRGVAPFTEAPITFLPTYKFDVGTSTYDTSSKRRTPSWTDRVLWKGGGVSTLCYTAIDSMTTSDHKPVVAVYRWDMPEDSKRVESRREESKRREQAAAEALAGTGGGVFSDRDSDDDDEQMMSKGEKIARSDADPLPEPQPPLPPGPPPLPPSASVLNDVAEEKSKKGFRASVPSFARVSMRRKQ